MSWVLIAILIYGPNTIAIERFPNQGSCEKAAKWIRENGGNLTAVVCMEDYKK